MEKKIGVYLHHLQNKHGDKYVLDLAKKIGADAFDFTLCQHDISRAGDLYSKGVSEVKKYFSDLKKYADSIGIEIRQTHGRLIGYGVTPEGNETFIKNAELDLIAAAELGAKYCVVHTPAYNWVGGDRSDDEMRDIGFNLFNNILPYAKREGVKIAAETHGDASKYGKMEFFGYINNLVELCEKIKTSTEYGDYICVCVDTGHTNLAVKYEGNPSVGDAIRELGSLVEVLHLHDNNGKKDQHKIPMTGDIDWNDVLNALDEINYPGYYNLESEITHFGEGFEAEEAAFAVKVMKHMLKTQYNK